MPVRAEGFDDDLDKLIIEVQTRNQEIALTWLQAIMIGTPVDTGFHRNNWQLDFGDVNARVEGSPPPSEQAGQALTSLPPLDDGSNSRLRAAASFLKSWKIDSGSIFIHNSAPAIGKLDSGEGSKQAPQGILDPATTAVRAKFRLA